jgi:hypothetical protein
MFDRYQRRRDSASCMVSMSRNQANGITVPRKRSGGLVAAGHGRLRRGVATEPAPRPAAVE